MKIDPHYERQKSMAMSLATGSIRIRIAGSVSQPRKTYVADALLLCGS